MPQKTLFLSLEQILINHEDQVERYGGTSGLRDLALLESALYRPQSTFAGQELYPTIFEKAAALMQSLVLNHPFVDGNKRTGTISAVVFLEINGYSLYVDQTDLVEATLHVASKEWDIEQIAVWLEKHSKKHY